VNIEKLKTLLSYSPETGCFTWRVRRNASGGPVTPGDQAGHLRDNGYTIIGIDGKIYRAHRLAWLYHYGVEPPKLIDHINGNRSDNRICNLREVTVSQNAQNTYKPHRDSRTGKLGVTQSKETGSFLAHISVGGRTRHLGSFKTAEAAADAYQSAKSELHPWAAR